MSTRRPRSDSTNAAIFAIKSAQQPLPDVPSHIALREIDRPFWSAIMTGRARSEWQPADLALACQLARCQADIEQEAATLTAEGSVLDGRANPRVMVLDVLTKRQMALMRTLRMGGSQVGRAETLQNGRRLERKYAGPFDDLIAKGMP